jgi:diguanylate cyclase
MLVDKTFVALHIGRTEGAPDVAAEPVLEADVLRRVLDGALGALADALVSDDAARLPASLAAIGQCRTQIIGGGGAGTIEPMARSCFETTRQIAGQTRNQLAEQRVQHAALVATVREVVATMAGDQANLHSTLTGSAERFERIGQLGDIRQIQAQLVKEVTDLKRVAVERRAAWEQKFEAFGTRLASLETQLDRTRREAALDPLTNIANRRAFERTSVDWLEPGRPDFVMAMVDVDDFKQINDSLGHAVGDSVLVKVAETIANAIRSGDVVARLGGDEFAVLAAGLTLGQAEKRFTAIGREVENACRPLAQGGPTPSLSIGIAECSAGDTLKSLQERADAALYQAKQNGKGRVASKPSPYIRDLRSPRTARGS